MYEYKIVFKGSLGGEFTHIGFFVNAKEAYSSAFREAFKKSSTFEFNGDYLRVIITNCTTGLVEKH